MVFVASTDVNDAVAVLISSTGQLGTVSSSRRGKENIEDMLESSSFINELRPVIFNYRADKKKTIHFGLIAEEVADVYANLVVFDEAGIPETVRNTMNCPCSYLMNSNDWQNV